MKILHRQFLKVVFIFLVPSIPLIFLGYGSDNDTYGVLSAGTSTWEDLTPSTSRHPGYWLYEAIVYVIRKLGGYILVNGITLVISVLVLYRFYRLAVFENISNPALLTLCLGLNPWFLIAATSTMDYIWALAFSGSASELAAKEKYKLAGLLAGIASGIRLGSAFTLALAFSLIWLKTRTKKSTYGFLLLTCISFFIITLFYFPSWSLKDRSFSFLKGHIGDESLWALKMHAGRFIYKTIYLFGLPSFILIIGSIAFYARNWKGQISDMKIGLAAIGGSLGTLALFAKYPLEISYLLPFLFFSLLLLGVYTGNQNRNFLLAILMATLSYSFINISIAKPNVVGAATVAHFGFFIEPGVLINDISKRLNLIECSNIDCWKKRH